jgi:NADPH:quinone reductase
MMASVRAIQVTSPGGPDAMRLEPIELGAPKDHEVLVKIVAAGVNYIDVYHRTGLYPKQAPFTLGLEGSGIVEAIGSRVSLFAPGDRVAWAGVPGSYATHVLAEESKLVHVPRAISMEVAAAAMLQGMTAQYLTRSTYVLAKHEWCLIHAAAGGVGLLLCQIAKRIGGRAIGTVSTHAKAELARSFGAEATIIYTEQDFAAEVSKITGGEKCAVVYDSVGKTTFEKSLDSLRMRGMMVLFGQSSGPVPPVDLQVLNSKGSLYIARPSIFHYVAKREELEHRAKEVFEWIEGGMQFRIHAQIPLADAANAHRRLESRETTGKLLLIP